MWKTLKTYAARAGRALKNTFSLSSPGTWFRKLSTSWSTRSYVKLARLAAQNPIAARAIEFIGDNIASIELRLVRKVDGEEEEVTDHPILDLLDQPAGPDNNRYTRTWLMQGFVWALMAGGEFWLDGRSPSTGPNSGQPRRLDLYDSSDFSGFQRDENDRIEGYHLTTRRGRTVDPDTERCLHAYTYHPDDKERGLPILYGVLRQLELLRDADEWNKAISENRGQLAGFFKPTNLADGQTLSPEQRDQAQDKVDEKVNDARGGHKWLVMNGAFEPVDTGISPQDAQWLEGSQYAGRLIATGLGIDPALLGDDAAQTYDNYRTALRVAYTTRILPMLDFILDALNRWLVPKYDDELKLTYDPTQIEALQEEQNEKVERLATAVEAGIMTIDEARQRIGLDTEGYDVPLVAMNRQPVTMLGLGTSGEPAHPEAGRSMSDEAFDKTVEELLAAGVGPGQGDGR